MSKYQLLETELGLVKQEDKQKHIYTGQVNGFYTVVEIEKVYVIRIGIIANEDNKEAIEEIKVDAFRNYGVAMIEENNSFVIAIQKLLPRRVKKAEEEMVGLIQQITTQLVKENILAGDFLRGQMDDSIHLYQVKDSYFYLSKDSYQQLLSDFSSTTEQGQTKTIKAGIVQATLGALIGAIIWALMFYLGFNVWFFSILSAVMALHFYVKKGGLLNTLGIISVSLVVISALVISLGSVYSIIVIQQDALSSFTQSEIFTSMMWYLLLGVLSVLIYIVYYSLQASENQKKLNRIRKL